MATYEAPRGVIKDLRFFTKQVGGGPLSDQYNWTDGLTHDQWPVVEFWTGPGATGTNITALVVKNITADTITSASHKDPTATTGVWREIMGTYWVRVQPQNALSFDDYYMRVSFLPTAGNTWVEDFTFEVLIPGDIDPNADIVPADIRVGFKTSFTDDEITPYIERATDDVLGELEAGGIEDPEAYFTSLGGMPRNIKTAIILLTQCYISGYDLSAGGRVRTVGEGSERLTFATAPKDLASVDPCTEWKRKVDLWLMQNAPGRQLSIGTITRAVGHTVNQPQGTSSDPDTLVMP